MGRLAYNSRKVKRASKRCNRHKVYPRVRKSYLLIEGKGWVSKDNFRAYHLCGTPNRFGYLYGNIGVSLDNETQEAHYHGRLACGSVWICPNCGSRIGYERADELRTAVDNFYQSSTGSVVFVTFTVPHIRRYGLEKSLDGISKAYQGMGQSRVFKDLMRSFGSMGAVRSVEITYGKNGWHPHFHVVYFLNDLSPEDFTSLQSLRMRLFAIWEKMVKKGQLGDPSFEAFDLQLVSRDSGAEIGAYVAGGTWDISDEMSKGQFKTPLDGGLTIQDIMEGAASYELTSEQWSRLEEAKRADLDSDEPLITKEFFGHRARVANLSHTQLIALFREYASVTKGRKQMFWSPGLRASLRLDVEKTDEELAQEADFDGEFLGIISGHDYMSLLNSSREVEFLESVEYIGWERTLASFGFKDIKGMNSVRSFWST